MQFSSINRELRKSSESVKGKGERRMCYRGIDEGRVFLVQEEGGREENMTTAEGRGGRWQTSASVRSERRGSCQLLDQEPGKSPLIHWYHHGN